MPDKSQIFITFIAALVDLRVHSLWDGPDPRSLRSWSIKEGNSLRAGSSQGKKVGKENLSHSSPYFLPREDPAQSLRRR